jgi:hypothetical protein
MEEGKFYSQEKIFETHSCDTMPLTIASIDTAIKVLYNGTKKVDRLMR